jgi:two-component sensor histidine kinase
MRELVPQHEEHWFDIYGRVAMTRRPERFENYAAGLKRHYEGFAFPVGPPQHRQVGLLFNDVSQRKQSEEHLKLMVNELNHRVKNSLALVQAIAQQSLKHEGIELGVRRAFEGRLATLAAAHNLLTQAHWEHASLRKLVLSTFGGCGISESRFSVQGPEVDLHATQAVPIAMALHELCTNAVKYGALSADAGHVYVQWYLIAATPPQLRIEWREEGGPPVVPPPRRGFGSMMVEQALAYELDGKVGIEFKPTGVECIIEAPVRALVQRGPG